MHPASTPWNLEAPWLLQQPAASANAALGAAIWLWMHDFRHRRVPLRDMENRLLVPLVAGQYVIARPTDGGSKSDGGTRVEDPAAVLLFARFDAKAESRYLDDPERRLATREWCSGDRLWLIDWCAPFGHTLRLRHAVLGLFEGHVPLRSLCRAQPGRVARVITWRTLPSPHQPAHIGATTPVTA